MLFQKKRAKPKGRRLCGPLYFVVRQSNLINVLVFTLIICLSMLHEMHDTSAINVGVACKECRTSRTGSAASAKFEGLKTVALVSFSVILYDDFRCFFAIPEMSCELIAQFDHPFLSASGKVVPNGSNGKMTSRTAL